MPKWEYLSVTAESVGREGASFRFSHWNYITEDQLDKFGAEGWEAVSANYDDEGTGLVAVLLKRPVEEGSG